MPARLPESEDVANDDPSPAEFPLGHLDCAPRGASNEEEMT